MEFQMKMFQIELKDFELQLNDIFVNDGSLII